MRVDICGREDEETVAALLEAIAAAGAVPEDAAFDDELPLGVGLHKFHATGGTPLTVYVDAWGVDLEGPDELVNRVLADMRD
jgi:hypothetical protein